MAITNFYFTGDLHGDFSRFRDYSFAADPNSALIILGDAGWNYYLNKKDERVKREFHQNYEFYVYCVRGNHEERPQNVLNMKLVYDENVGGEVYFQVEFPRIRYFKDYGEYTIAGHKTLVIGGAYSVDKEFRLINKFKWFPQEQLSKSEMAECDKMVAGKEYDFVLTHTCPFDWRPTDLFLSMIDQSTVDTSMENFLLNIRDHIKYKVWLFGHYHADRLERPRVEIYYNDTDNLENIWERWKIPDDIPYWLPKSPNYYME